MPAYSYCFYLCRNVGGVDFEGAKGDLKTWGKRKMVTLNTKAMIKSDIHKVWDVVLAVEDYSTWRTDLCKTEVLNEKQFVEYTNKDYATTFTITTVEPYQRWEFDMENSNMKGHWIGIFTSKGNETEIDFTEYVTAKKFFMKPLIKAFLKKQQQQFVNDLQKAVEQ